MHLNLYMCFHNKVKYEAHLAVINQAHLRNPHWLKKRLIIANIMAIQLQTRGLLGNADLNVEVSLKPPSQSRLLITQLDSHYHPPCIKKTSCSPEGVVTSHFDR
jgi:hypothetical protein